MRDSSEFTKLEFVLLQLIANGEGKWSWYELASHLSRLDVPREPDMMVVLKTLAAEGLVERFVQSASPRVKRSYPEGNRWALTEAGKIRLGTATQMRGSMASHL